MNASHPGFRALPTAGERLVAALYDLAARDDRAALAALRSSLQDLARAHLAYPLVLRHLPRDVGRDYEDACLLVAGLFGIHPTPIAGAPLGVALRTMASRASGAGLERRCEALLQCAPRDLRAHLRPLVRLARSLAVPLDYLRLLEDVRHWGHPAGWVQRRLAGELWAGGAPSTTDDAQESCP